MNLDEFFPHQICINLNTRPDRWERITERFVEQGLNQVTRFPAVDGRNLEIPPVWRYSAGAYGCLQSHLAIIEQARKDGKPSVLIFEDDAVLAPGFASRFADYVKQLPDDWDMLFLGGLHGEPPTKVADNVVRITHSLSTYAYALKHTIYDGFIEMNQQSLTVLDENTRALQKHFNCYCFMPHLAWVEEDYSDIRGEKSNPWWLKESLVLFGPEIDAIMKKTVAVISYCNNSANSLKNLLFTTDYLYQKLPGITFLVLEQGTEQSLKQSNLPPGCHLELVEDSAGCNQSYLLKRGLDLYGSSKDFFMFLDSDVFLTREDIRANLLKCLDYDIASSFCEIYDLNEHDTDRIFNGDVCWDYDSTYPSRKKAAIYDLCCIVTQKAMRILSELEKFDHQNEDLLSMKAKRLLRVYTSPNRARCLFSR
jgi:glycosyl transferase family 25